MYSTCIFCNTGLGANQVVEEFPVGRRLAFDPGKGRLWVLCPRCRQWNLSPVEERWEALEALERLYRDTAKRYSTDQIGLARHDEGLEVVRIGRPTRPEYAAWRYGGELMRRRRKAVVLGTATVAAGAVIVGGVSAGLLAGGAFNVLNLGLNGTNLYRTHFRRALHLVGPDGTPLQVTEMQAKYAAVEPAEEAEGGWRLVVSAMPDTPEGRRDRRRRMLRGGLSAVSSPARNPKVALSGDEAVRVAGKLLPKLNRSGASSRLVGEAARFVEEAGSADDAFRKASGTVPSAWRALSAPMRASQNALYRLPGPIRLGLEMAAQEESERRALEGELALLEHEWREAEEIAAIADDLLLPDRIRHLLARRRRPRDSSAHRTGADTTEDR